MEGKAMNEDKSAKLIAAAQFALTTPGMIKGRDELAAAVREALDDSEYAEALHRARSLAVSLAAKHYPEAGFQPFDTLSLVVSQIDNMTTGLVRKSKAAEFVLRWFERRKLKQ